MEGPESGTGPGSQAPGFGTGDGTVAHRSGTRMSIITRPRLVGAVAATLLLLAAFGAPVATYAVEPDAVQPSVDIQPARDDAADGEPTPAESTDDGFEGEIVYDPFFVSPEPDATPGATVSGDLARSTDAPRLTPPATDTIVVGAAATGGASVPLLLAALAALSITVFALGRVPGARTR